MDCWLSNWIVLLSVGQVLAKDRAGERGDFTFENGSGERRSFAFSDARSYLTYD